MDKYNRRKFLLQARNLTYAGATSWLCGCGGAFSSNQGSAKSSPKESEDEQQIIVIGAGIAGIAAAKKLQSQGYRVIILEGRDRIGGRMWTDDSLGVPLDLGAAWIHTVDDNPISPLVKQFGIQTVVSDIQSQWNYKGINQLLNESEEQDISRALRVFKNRVNKLKKAPSSSRQTTLAEIAQQIIESEEITGITLKGFRAALSSAIETEVGDDLANLGVKGFDEDSGFSGADVVFPKGYIQLVQALSKDLDIRTQHLVQQIAYDDTGVQVTTDRGVFSGSRVIVTVPLGVLKRGTLKFSPPLPESKLAAIQQLGMGALNKLVLKFPKQFWASEPHTMAYVNGNNPDRYVEFYNWQKYIQQPILVAIFSGNFSRSLSQMPPTDAVQNIMADLQAMFGKDIPLPTATFLTQWHNDPFAYGSYSTFSLNGSIQDCDRLAEPIGDRVFFAGEATYGKHLGTVHGALLSGEREANRIAKVS
ncbi:flavin monoamine oxidase family protein [Pseudanabaena yagii]|uniref:FAD-dependent oxidoreductase n=1 Tax=Pseudanabaena yagii GIHE-NHR1 TaxID=2722753 RepID=A0ABX1LM09_9CYAN|nr:NAD(P)/FAD-dependent oxidoreductase [Pseudanabaena yagii]NMF56481.1 FAD-dependent oxidoreductase [Pseudanabaena yagii GIHE-NHR1]